MNYAYQRGSQPILSWRDGPPRQTRAADSVALGSLGGTTLSGPTIILPRPGAPEVINGAGVGGLGGCGCHGSCGCGPSAVSGFVDAVPGGYLTLAAAAVVAWMVFKKKR